MVHCERSDAYGPERLPMNGTDVPQDGDSFSGPPETGDPVTMEDNGAARGGVLTGSQILAHNLIDNPLDKCVKAASYDLRLGRDAFLCGKGTLALHDLTAKGRVKGIEIEPFGTALVSTIERVRTPHNIVGRFDLKIAHALDGFILQVGPQVEPEYDGPLFGILLNTTAAGKFIPYEESIFTIEFHLTSEPPDRAQPKKIIDLEHFMKSHGADFERLKKENVIQGLQTAIDDCQRALGLRREQRRLRVVLWISLIGIVIAALTFVGLRDEIQTFFQAGLRGVTMEETPEGDAVKKPGEGKRANAKTE
ncbi:MAG: hypothetical protein IH984_08330 [Planctomycetes bacterium]|nr:hypothetical protein [Planctomycetota bacterium]